MTASIHPMGINHPNAIVRDGEAAIACFKDLFGAEVMMEVPTTTCRAVLVEIGHVIVELFVPNEFLINARHGPHFLGLEYWVDIDEARAAMEAHGVRILTDHGHVIHTEPADAFGISFEFYGRSFFVPDSPIPTPLKPEAHWLAQPLGLSGLKGYTVAVQDADAAAAFFKSFLSGEPLYEEARPELGARAVGLSVAGSLVEFLAPVGDGLLLTELCRTGQGIRSFILRTADLARAKAHLAGRGLALVAGSSPSRFGISPEATQGVLFEIQA